MPSGLPLHVRECTLTSILAFLLHSGPSLVTLDTSRRIVVLLSNTLAFVDGFAAQNPHLLQEHAPEADRSTLSLLDREFLLRRRLFQCLTVLAHDPAMEPMHDGLIKRPFEPLLIRTATSAAQPKQRSRPAQATSPASGRWQMAMPLVSQACSETPNVCVRSRRCSARMQRHRSS